MEFILFSGVNRANFNFKHLTFKYVTVTQKGSLKDSSSRTSDIRGTGPTQPRSEMHGLREGTEGPVVTVVLEGGTPGPFNAAGKGD